MNIFKTFKWFNYYNLFCYSFVIVLVLILPHIIFSSLNQFQFRLVSFIITKILTVTSVFLLFSGTVCILSLIIPLYASKGKLKFIKSLWVTHKIRCFSRFEKGKTSETNISVSATDAEKNLANAAVRTLTVSYYQDRAIVSIKLPENDNAQKLLLEKLPRLRDKLNALQNGYTFNDLTAENDRLYSAEGAIS